MTITLVSQPPAVVHEKPKPELKFQDLPYTEWRATRWTYHDQTFAGWPTLPTSIANISQITHGTLGKTEGFWLLTDTELYFVRNFSSLSTKVEFVNVSQTLDLMVTEGSMVAVDNGGKVYLATSENITLLDCTDEFEF